ncbi:hypothetical protein BO71DRAFT_430139 [Aspergillus ellipticus CBS 707.79]|uniref:Uncharacterized protein n=1 Tax=Aspergillus ellipticus CBS 707.79 TaxID=1448320 RepID=A0A319DAT6_9EURO|nr:hypothetical protein BO71DRAFT_430139 [Aspergillus ellipticus CBS 707.79]
MDGLNVTVTIETGVSILLTSREIRVNDVLGGSSEQAGACASSIKHQNLPTTDQALEKYGRHENWRLLNTAFYGGGPR